MLSSAFFASVKAETGAVLKVEDSGPIDALKKPEEIRAEPLALPNGFEWCTMDVKDDAQVRGLICLLRRSILINDH